MAKAIAKSASALRYDDFVAKVIPNPKESTGAIILKGYLGKSIENGYVRVYFSADLNRFIDILESDVLYSVPTPAEEDPLGGSTLWVRKTTEYAYGGTLGGVRHRSKFLEGAIIEQYKQEIQQEEASSKEHVGGEHVRPAEHSLLCVTENPYCIELEVQKAAVSKFRDCLPTLIPIHCQVTQVNFCLGHDGWDLDTARHQAHITLLTATPACDERLARPTIIVNSPTKACPHTESNNCRSLHDVCKTYTETIARQGGISEVCQYPGMVRRDTLVRPTDLCGYSQFYCPAPWTDIAMKGYGQPNQQAAIPSEYVCPSYVEICPSHNTCVVENLAQNPESKTNCPPAVSKLLVDCPDQQVRADASWMNCPSVIEYCPNFNTGIGTDGDGKTKCELTIMADCTEVRQDARITNFNCVSVLARCMEANYAPAAMSKTNCELTVLVNCTEMAGYQPYQAYQAYPDTKAELCRLSLLKDCGDIAGGYQAAYATGKAGCYTLMACPSYQKYCPPIDYARAAGVPTMSPPKTLQGCPVAQPTYDAKCGGEAPTNNARCGGAAMYGTTTLRPSVYDFCPSPKPTLDCATAFDPCRPSIADCHFQVPTGICTVTDPRYCDPYGKTGYYR